MTTFNISVNRHFINKLGKGDPRWGQYNDTFENVTLTQIQLRNEIRNGHAITSPHRHERHMLPSGKQSAYRHSLNWISSQHLGLDHDDLGFDAVLDLHDCFLCKYGSFLYETVSHTPQAPRTRSILILDQPITDKDVYAEASAALHWKFSGYADSSCADPARNFFGSKDCEIRNIGNVLPLAVVDELRAEFRAAIEAERARRKPAGTYYASTPDLAKLQEAIKHLPRQQDYHEWLDVLMGVHSEHPGSDGIAILEAWSPGYPGEIERKFASFNRNGNGTGKVGVGTVFHMAKQYGYTNGTPPPIRIVDADGVIHDINDTPAEPPPVDDSPEEHHPLDIQPQAGLQLGWIDEYADFMTKLTASPREFNVLAGKILVATVIQRRARLRMSFGDIYPNIYGAFIARSSVYRKSSSTAKARQMMQRAMMDNLLLSELMTSEGLLKQLQDKPSGLVIRDEIGTLFASHNIKYLANLKPDLTALYDCYPYSRRLSNDEVKVPSPYLNILGATTPARFFEGVTFTDWQDGFLARWLFVVPDKEPDFDAMTGLFTNDHDARMGQLAVGLMKLDKEPARDFTLMDEAFALWDKWQRNAAKEAYYYGDDITAAIVTRYAAYALKFSIILAAINGNWGIITIETMQTAMSLADNYKATAHKLLTEKANYGVSGAKLQKIFRVIKGKAGLDGLTAREIGQYCNMRKGELTPCLEKLVSIGGVITNKSGRTERYIPAVESLPAKTW